ncbi:class I SAM-dependent methyltransferase [Reinekea blandensis]|uniref:Putative glycosyltransferase n=1 Tax=Reinekea blandensis MED297 TaxID=314283 RepID=A4BKF0_9GAMM|nr:class I SAM-dependent methyltransferase [Reinekea blandensis]EAR07397.1 putative glycosyltransferase [Reinekea sp. MED297] [Reinekea blandensis MED297]
MKNNIETTGERLIEETYITTHSGYVIYLFHKASYELALPYCKDKKVIDLGCGSGYGSTFITKVSKNYTGVDVSNEAVLYAQERYGNNNTTFMKISSSEPLPFSDNSFDTALSFQVIEHVKLPDSYLQEAKRILKPNGTLIIITPDKANRLLCIQQPWNRWHLVEYSLDELKALAGKQFKIAKATRMGAIPEIANVELNRCKKIKWVTLILTLKIYPTRVRVAFLNALHNIISLLPKKKKHLNIETPLYTSDGIKLGVPSKESINLVVICKKTN